MAITPLDDPASQQGSQPARPGSARLPDLPSGRYLTFPFTACVLAYGDYPDLVERCLTSLYRHTPASAFRLRVGMNEPSGETRRRVHALLASRSNVDAVHEWTPQIYKYPAMRRLLDEPPLATGWVAWFDDDSYVESADWLHRMSAVIDRQFDRETERYPRGYRMFGKKLYDHLDEDQLAWIRAAPWYRGRPARLDPGTTPPRPKSDFISGGFWLAPAAVLRECDWPDPRIRHNGGDVMTGEALYQLGYGATRATDGVRINASTRRGYREPAAGRARTARTPEEAAAPPARRPGGVVNVALAWLRRPARRPGS